MSDRELLELAAKAAGDFTTAKYYRVADDLPVVFMLNDKPWNPLKDDGDALRLAVKLGLRDYFGIEIQKTCTQATSFEPWEHCEYEEFKEQNPYAATRRAIVRAAAEIGKQQEKNNGN
jgi:hypothetical protein